MNEDRLCFREAKKAARKKDARKNRLRYAIASEPVKKGRISISLFFGTNLILPLLWDLIHKCPKKFTSCFSDPSR